jgi:CRISPR-associated endonuclease/helicase Cas3
MISAEGNRLGGDRKRGGELPPIAHVLLRDSGEYVVHDLAEHLRATARQARDFAAIFDGGDWAYLSGLWHDIGKYSEDFQKYIRGTSGFEKTEAHIETGMKGRVNHSSAGALLAIDKLGLIGRIPAYLIAGHHAGIPDWHVDESGPSALSVRVANRSLLDDLDIEQLPADFLKQPVPPFNPPGGKAGFHLYVRMLYSALVDADFLDTETFMDPGNQAKRGQFADISELLVRFNLFMENMRETARHTDVNALRNEVLNSCIEKSVAQPGLFLLEVPTGGGKTLSSMAFALNHAVKHGKRRIIYIIPFTSIIEQTADIFRNIFGENVIEHHSNLDPDQETAKSRLAAENWDAPIIVTTNVQFFESLFAARSSRCRKLHNIVDSVIILDEAQLLPPQFLQPIIDVLNLLMRHYGVTLVLSTATQPFLSSIKWFDGRLRGLTNIDGSVGISIITDADRLFERLERVDYMLPQTESALREWKDIAEEISRFDTVLCVVNTRKACREMYRLMPPGTYHLSALMCGEHRSRVIKEIKERLRNRSPVRVVSTQLVEAGVDLDFPVVYRAMTGLDSIVQAAGRCNREGGMERGLVVVFNPPEASPPGLLRKAEDAAKSVLIDWQGSSFKGEIFNKYFQIFSSQTELDKKGIVDLLKCDSQLELQFKTAAIRFQLIDESTSASLFVRYGEGPALIDQLKRKGPESWLLRKLQRFVVSLSKYAFGQLLSQGKVVEVYPGFYAQEFDGFYDDNTGVKLADEMIEPTSLML